MYTDFKDDGDIESTDTNKPTSTMDIGLLRENTESYETIDYNSLEDTIILEDSLGQYDSGIESNDGIVDALSIFNPDDFITNTGYSYTKPSIGFTLLIILILVILIPNYIACFSKEVRDYDDTNNINTSVKKLRYIAKSNRKFKIKNVINKEESNVDE